MNNTPILVFGHKSPDTDATASPMIWAWYLCEVKGVKAEAVVQDKPGNEALFVLQHWGFEVPRMLGSLATGTRVIIVDTNNPDELPDNIGEAQIEAIIDHHKLFGGLTSAAPIEVVMQPLAATASVMLERMGAEAAGLPAPYKGLALSCIISDTLGFRSPTTTEYDRKLGRSLAAELKVNIDELSELMFAAKSDISAFSAAELLRMDSKIYPVGDKRFRVSVLETTSPATVLERKDDLFASMPGVEQEDGVDGVLLFVIDILEGDSTLLLPGDLARQVVRNSFGVEAEASGDTVVLPGVVSRKKQIVPVLALQRPA